MLVGFHTKRRGANLGSFRGNKHKSSLTLSLDIQPLILIAGHSTSLLDLLRVAKGEVTIDSFSMRQLVDNPSGDPEAVPETAAGRAAAMRARMNELRAQGRRDFRKQVAKEFGIDPSRVGQLLREYPEAKLTTDWFPNPAASKPRSPPKARKK